ncbi:hypothetical protein [uncultured Anaerococcus sp.]|uniref:hypothetical protein n=1 Tax=uncultured Anaerococcus sp. TaxID=293428 RepID=UPI0026221CB8|nr:hypothetical protein [uncultured Anaerococcus sp.]
MYCNEILETVRGDTFEINIFNKDYDISNGDIVKMSIKRNLDEEVIWETEETLKTKEVTTLKFTPDQMKDLEGFYYLDIEISNKDRSYVYTPLLADIKVKRDVTRNE